MEKKVMKACLRCQRGKGAKGANHNDRTLTANAKHIDPNKEEENIYYSHYGKWHKIESGKGLLAIEELAYYEERFGAGRRAQLEKHIKSRHYDRAEKCTIENYYKDARTAPDQMVLQIGKKKDRITKEELMECVTVLVNELQKETSENARIHVLNVALHGDETTPHVHVGFVAEYKNPKTGYWEMSQDNCLKELGYEKPYPGKKNSKKNNRKIPFTDKMRQKWYDIIEEKLPNITIDREPDKEKKYAELDHEIGQKEQKLEAIEDRLTEKWSEEKEADKRIAEKMKELADFEKLEEIKSAWEKEIQRSNRALVLLTKEHPEDIFAQRELERRIHTQQKTLGDLTAYQQQMLKKVKKEAKEDRGWDYDDR